MMAEDNVYSEQELSKMADELLSAAGETELIERAAQAEEKELPQEGGRAGAAPPRPRRSG